MNMKAIFTVMKIRAVVKIRAVMKKRAVMKIRPETNSGLYMILNP